MKTRASSGRQDNTLLNLTGLSRWFNASQATGANLIRLSIDASPEALRAAGHTGASTLYREDILAHAYAQCRLNKGAPGVDGQEFADVEAYGRQWPVRRIQI
jgi:hypothetical protein